jgi:uncharacterized RDD family membrane protein YckC
MLHGSQPYVAWTLRVSVHAYAGPMVRSTSSWLSGPDSVDSGATDNYPGQALGLPEQGSRSLARSGRRFLALLIDWFIAYGLAGLAIPLGLLTADTLRYTWVGSVAVLVIWLLIGAASVRMYGFSPGQLALGLQVVTVDGRLHVGLGRALIRGLLLAFVIPALFMDGDGRGLHDKATFTAVVRR